MIVSSTTSDIAQSATTPHDAVAPLLKTARLIVCCGPGGVGKTTTAAALGLRGALMGRKVIVLTIDPARRLANSLGLEALSNTPQHIDIDAYTEQDVDPGQGQLWAMMLDQKKTLDDLVKRFAPDPGAFERAEQNNIYRLLSSTLHGMQEYMALDKLHDLYTSQRFDLVVLDTPPTKNALEFLETPSRAKTFFDERIIKWFIPNRGGGGLFKKVFDPGSVVLKLLGKIFGEQFVSELAEFFETLEFLQQALQSRGEMIDYIMRDEQTHFVVISSADPRRIKEALFFHEKLGELGQRADAFLVNRVIPHFQDTDLQGFDPDAIETMAKEDLPDEIAQDLHGELASTYRALSRLAHRDRQALADLSGRIGREVMQSIPMLGQDIHSIEQLLNLSEFLTPSRPLSVGAK